MVWGSYALKTLACLGPWFCLHFRACVPGLCLHPMRGGAFACMICTCLPLVSHFSSILVSHNPCLQLVSMTWLRSSAWRSVLPPLAPRSLSIVGPELARARNLSDLINWRGHCFQLYLTPSVAASLLGKFGFLCRPHVWKSRALLHRPHSRKIKYGWWPWCRSSRGGTRSLLEILGLLHHKSHVGLSTEEPGPPRQKIFRRRATTTLPSVVRSSLFWGLGPAALNSQFKQLGLNPECPVIIFMIRSCSETAGQRVERGAIL